MTESKSLYRKKVQAMESYWDFIDLINFKGGTKSFSAIHKELAAFIADRHQHPRRLVLMPRGHLKSTLCSVGYVLWRIYQNPCIRILVGTATKPLATSFVREVKQYLEDTHLQETVWNTHPRYGRLIPQLDNQSAGDEEVDRKTVWRVDAIQVLRPKIMKEPTLLAASVGSPSTGFHFDIAILDDVVTFENSQTAERREKIMDWVGDVESVIDPYNPDTDLGGEFLILGTRYYYRDLYGVYTGEDLSDEEQGDGSEDYAVFKRNIYANGKDDSDGYLWPERFNAEVVSRLKSRLMRLPNGMRRFASQYLNTIMTDEETVLNADNIQYINPAQLTLKDDGVIEIRTSHNSPPTRVKPILVVDPAISQSKRADNTVLMVGGLDSNRSLYLFDLKVGKFKPEETVRLVFELVDRWKLNALTIDNEKLGQALMYTIRQSFSRFKPVALREYHAEGEKKARIATYLEPLFVNHQVYLMTWMAKNTILMEEIQFFPRSGAHDDCLDGMVMICQSATPTRNGVMSSRRKRIRQHYNINQRYGGVR
jgi:predicted phage terminase large subunit-like protein